jgi:tRNA-2-methylthio-N6-dimethylallyladenosine synthase
MPKVLIKTYGCQMNERDSEQVARMLVARGYEITSSESEADVVLLNTCSVRDMAEQKALGKMRLLVHQHKGEGKIYGFLGCMAQSRGAELAGKADLVVGTQKFHRVADYVDQLIARRQTSPMDDERFSIVDVDPENGSQEAIRDHALRPRQPSAFVSIMQGCNMRCTFCIVPQTRGPERSRAIPEVVREVEGLVARGVKEITLLGQIVNLYGRHELPKVDGKTPFVQLLEAVHAVEGLERLRFTSPHPIGYKTDLIDAFARLPKLAEHVHLPLQSGSDRILKAMHRGYTAQAFVELAAKMRAARPGLAITTDIIVGFPGETEEDFQATREVCRQVRFDNAFIFRYSRRKDTPAAVMEEQIDEATLEVRNQDLLEFTNGIIAEILQGYVGQRVEVLCEGPSKHNKARLTGRTRSNKIVLFEGADALIGQLVHVDVKRTSGFCLYGDVVLP